MTRLASSWIVIAGALFVATQASGRIGVATDPARAKHEEPGATPTRVETSPTLTRATFDRKLADLALTEQKTKAEMSEVGQKLADVKARVVARGRVLYRMTKLGMLPVGDGFEALVSHASRVERARRSLHGELSEERTLRRRGAELAQNLERIANDRASLETQSAAMEAARVASEEDDRRKVAFDHAFETSSGNSEYVAVYGGNGSEPVAIGGFGASRGRLLFPVTGRAEVRPSKREGDASQGLEIGAPLGATVRAVFAGRVAFADRYGAYGRIVILDHGERYYTVSGNLASVDVRVGDEISAGERIGSVGDEGKGPTLYFELRHGSQTIPPGPWLGVDRARARAAP